MQRTKAWFLAAFVNAMLLWIALNPTHELPSEAQQAKPLLVTLLPLPVPSPADPPPVHPQPLKLKADAGGQRHQQSLATAQIPALPPVAATHVDVVNSTPLPVTANLATVNLITPSRVLGTNLDAGGKGLAVNGGDGAGTGTGEGAGSGPGAIDVLSKADWVWTPTDESLSPFAPPEAAAQHVSGKAIIACRVQLSTHVHDCKIISESPVGFGFGSAAIAASRVFRIHPPRRNGKRLDDAWVGIPVLWISRTHSRFNAVTKKAQANSGVPAPTGDSHHREAARSPPAAPES